MDEALVHFGRLATGPIIEIMRSSKSSEAKIAGAAILARIGIGTPTVITTLQIKLRSPTDEERSTAADALVELGLPGLETFPDLVQNQSYSPSTAAPFLASYQGQILCLPTGAGPCRAGYR